jgi:hypothetical protein
MFSSLSSVTTRLKIAAKVVGVVYLLSAPNAAKADSAILCTSGPDAVCGSSPSGCVSNTGCSPSGDLCHGSRCLNLVPVDPLSTCPAPSGFQLASTQALTTSLSTSLTSTVGGVTNLSLTGSLAAVSQDLLAPTTGLLASATTDLNLQLGLGLGLGLNLGSGDCGCQPTPPVCCDPPPAPATAVPAPPSVVMLAVGGLFAMVIRIRTWLRGDLAPRLLTVRA